MRECVGDKTDPVPASGLFTVRELSGDNLGAIPGKRQSARPAVHHRVGYSQRQEAARLPLWRQDSMACFPLVPRRQISSSYRLFTVI